MRKLRKRASNSEMVFLLQSQSVNNFSSENLHCIHYDE